MMDDLFILYVSVVFMGSITLLAFLYLFQARIMKNKGQSMERLLKVGLFHDLDHHVSRVLQMAEEAIYAPTYGLYRLDVRNGQYVLKSVRIQEDARLKVGPSYSGLVPYEKERYHPPLSLPCHEDLKKTAVIQQGEVTLLNMVINERTIIQIGPIKTITKKQWKWIRQFAVLMEKHPISAFGVRKRWKEYGKSHSEEKGKASVDVNSLRRDRLHMSKTFALYYGYGKADQLSFFDIAIIEPKGMRPEEIQSIQNRKTLVFSYLSLIEVHPSEPIFASLKKEDFLSVNGRKIRNDSFGTYLMNLRSKRWMDYLLTEARYRLHSMGTDGLFLDTVGDLELAELPSALKADQMDALSNLFYTMDLLYPNHLFIQNNGIESLFLRTAPWIDGIVWENPPLTLQESKEWVDFMLTRLDRLVQEHSIRIFLLFEASLEEKRKALPIAKKLGKEKNYLVYLASENYVADVLDG
ncbi:hypothetical protein [Priestia abyssalis]|uniref:hypothetical protein n=1 Tax=Priestia abyssalis TaxID=1221450 RepID=UPI000995D8E8|nr:hypothetical protein [Priestia abyssalis]